MAQARKKKRKPQTQNKVIKPEIQTPGGGNGDGGQPTEDYRMWTGRISAGKRRRRDWEERFNVRLLAQYFLGQQAESDPEMRVVNKFEATIDTMLPNVFLTSPKFFVRPKPGRSTPITERQAAVSEALLEAIGDQDQNLKNAVRLGLQQAFFRLGVLKTCYDPKLVPNPRRGEPMFSRRTKIDPETGEPVPIKLKDPKTRGEIIEPDEIVSDDAYRYEWVDARKIILPDDGPDQKKWTWIAEEIEVPLQEAKDNPAFPASKRSMLKSNRKKEEGGAVQPSLEMATDPDAEMFVYTEIWDIMNREHKIIAEGQFFQDFLVDEPLPAGVEDHPYAILAAKPITDPEPEAWPKPLTHSWADLQEEYNQRRFQIWQAAKGSARKIYYDDNTFPDADEAMKALASARDLEAVKVNDVVRPPVQTNDAPVNAIVLQDIALLNADWQLVTGTTPSELFGVSGGSETAFEAGLVQRQADARDAMFADQVQDWLATAGKKMYQRVKATMTVGMWVAMREFKDRELVTIAQNLFGIAPDQLEAFPQIKAEIQRRFSEMKMRRVNRSHIVFEADVSVVPGSARPKNTVQERLLLERLTAQMGQNPGPFTMPSWVERLLRAYDVYDDLLVEQIVTMAKNQIKILANQAGRNQGGENPGMEANGAVPGLLAQMAGGIQQ